MLQGERWAITVDRVATVVAVSEADVKWHRNPRDSMILGTIKSSLAQLLNPVAIAGKLDDGDVFRGAP